MEGKLPEELDAALQQLTERCIAGRATVEEQLEGAENLCSAYWEVLETLIGQTGTRAGFRRAVSMASRKHTPLASLTAPDACIDIRSLAESLLGEGPDRSRPVLVGLMEELVHVVYGLLGPVLMPVLQEAEEKLEERAQCSGGGKEDL